MNRREPGRLSVVRSAGATMDRSVAGCRRGVRRRRAHARRAAGRWTHGARRLRRRGAAGRPHRRRRGGAAHDHAAALRPASGDRRRGQDPDRRRFVVNRGDGFRGRHATTSVWRLHAEGSIAAMAPAHGRAADRARPLRRDGRPDRDRRRVGRRSDAGAVDRARRRRRAYARRRSRRTARGSRSAAAIRCGWRRASAPDAIDAAFTDAGPRRAHRLARATAPISSPPVGAGGLALLDVGGDRFGVVGGFPAPPRSIACSGPANALVASGAYRIAAWDSRPRRSTASAPARSRPGGRGRVGGRAIAALPSRKFVAAAYANGQIVIAALGRRDELQLQASGPSRDGACIASPDGRMLADCGGRSRLARRAA